MNKISNLSDCEESKRSASKHEFKKLILILNKYKHIPLTNTEQKEIKDSVELFLSRDRSVNTQRIFLIDDFEFLNNYIHCENTENSIRLGLSYFSAMHFAKYKENLMVCHFINVATEFADIGKNIPQGTFLKLAELALNSDHTHLAIDLLFKEQISQPVFNEKDKRRLHKTYHAIRSVSLKEKQHGHDLLLDYLSSQIPETLKEKIVIEIGTTRENIQGQGSTRFLAEFCKKFSLQFTTVDMDPNNSLSAQRVFSQLNVGFQARNMKGEDFLKDFDGTIDYVFLDAYDFDHGMHSTLRQERYKKYLGTKIDEEQCHKMHLDCSEALLDKLSPDGIICFDDTWQNENGEWTAKGTLAVPYLIEHGFEVIEARNNAILMKRKIIDNMESF